MANEPLYQGTDLWGTDTEKGLPSQLLKELQEVQTQRLNDCCLPRRRRIR